MTEKSQFPKIDLIERDIEKKLICDSVREVVEGASRVLYFEARGGLGKTRLLQDYPVIVAQDSLHVLTADTIDMYDFENRKPIEIERKIVDSLKTAAKKQRMSE